MDAWHEVMLIRTVIVTQGHTKAFMKHNRVKKIRSSMWENGVCVQVGIANQWRKKSWEKYFLARQTSNTR